MAETFFSILKTECVYRQKIATFRQAKELIDEFIHFYNHERIQLKTGVAPLRANAATSVPCPDRSRNEARRPQPSPKMSQKKGSKQGSAGWARSDRASSRLSKRRSKSRRRLFNSRPRRKIILG